jgi:hypothetical protein
MLWGVFLSDTKLKNALWILIYRKEDQKSALDLLESAKKSSCLLRKKVDIYVDGLDVDAIADFGLQ